MGDVADTINVGGVLRPVTNSAGRLIHPTKDGVRNFWCWFGNSEVVDANGKPLVVYHGTSKEEVEEFVDKSGRSGFYFSESASYAGAFAEGDGANILPVYLAIRNPADLRHGVPQSVAGNLSAAGYSRLQELISDDPAEYWQYLDGDAALRQALEASGYDGIRLTEPKINGGWHESWVAFGSEQIKSAIGNRGTFDPSDPRLTDGAGDQVDTRPAMAEPPPRRRRLGMHP